MCKACSRNGRRYTVGRARISKPTICLTAGVFLPNLMISMLCRRRSRRWQGPIGADQQSRRWPLASSRNAKTFLRKPIWLALGSSAHPCGSASPDAAFKAACRAISQPCVETGLQPSVASMTQISGEMRHGHRPNPERRSIFPESNHQMGMTCPVRPSLD